MLVRVICALIALAASPACSAERAELTVFAASSLTDAFGEIGDAFEREYDVDVVFNFAASPLLARQIDEGAPADVFASADITSIDELGSKIVDDRTFVQNRLAIAVPKGNPGRIDSLADLGATDAVVVLCAQDVPCGRYAEQALRRARVTVKPTSREANVRAVLTKVALGEADAGIVYASDLASTEDAEAVEIPARYNVAADYGIGVVAGSDDADLADAFVDTVLSDGGRATLARHGFETR